MGKFIAEKYNKDDASRRHFAKVGHGKEVMPMIVQYNI